ncbi:unnamed protein product [Bubo scandiacus]
MPREDLPGGEGVSIQCSLTWRPLADAREPVLAPCTGAEGGPVCISPQASREVANRSHQLSDIWGKTALEGTSKSPDQNRESGINTENKLVNRVEEEISDTCPGIAAAERLASRRSSQAWGSEPRRGRQQAWGQEHQHSSQHLMELEPAGDAQEPGAQEMQESEGSGSEMGDVVWKAGSDVSVSQKQELWGQIFELEQTCRPAWEQESPRAASPWSLRQDSWHSPQEVSRGGSWQSLGPDSCLGDEPWQSGWQPLRGDSPLSTDSRERAEQAQRVAYSPEEGTTWVSRRTTRRVTNRSQQTSQVWSKKHLAEILKSPAQKSERIIDTENKSVNGAEKEISDICPETTKQPTRQASRRGSKLAWGKESRRGSEPGWGQKSQRGSEKGPGQESRRHSEPVWGQESRHGSEHVPGQESQCGSEKVPGQQSQPCQPGERESRQPDKQSEDGSLPSDSMLLTLRLECGNLQALELVVEEQTAELQGKNNQARAEHTVQLSQGSTAGLGAPEQMYSLPCLKGSTWMGRTGKILISCDEETDQTPASSPLLAAGICLQGVMQKEGHEGKLSTPRS